MTDHGRFAINLLVNDNHEILLLKRAAANSIGPGQWGLPAGHIEPGETPRQCSTRELLEEIGDRCELELLNHLGPVRDTFFGGRYLIFLFHYHWIKGEIILNHEHTEYAWVSRADYRSYDVVDGIDEDIHYLGIWPDEFLNPDKLTGRQD